VIHECAATVDARRRDETAAVGSQFAAEGLGAKCKRVSEESPQLGLSNEAEAEIDGVAKDAGDEPDDRLTLSARTVRSTRE